MSDSTSSGDKSSAKSSDSKAKDSGSGEASTSKPTDAGKSAKDSIGGAAGVHYGFFSSVRSPEYRSGWDDIWGGDGNKPRRKTHAKTRSNSNSKTAAKPVTVTVEIEDLPADIRDGLIEAARKKMRKSRSSYDALDSSGRVDWTIGVTVGGGRS